MPFKKTRTIHFLLYIFSITSRLSLEYTRTLRFEEYMKH